MNKLQAYLNIHVQWLESMISGVAPGEDLPPLLSFADENNRMKFMPMPSGSNLSQWARDKLEDAEAVIYATVTAGDRDGTLLSVFLVERDKEGRITGLAERKEPSNCWVGPMADLLVTRH